MRRLRPPSRPKVPIATNRLTLLVLAVLHLALAAVMPLAAQTVGSGPRFALVIGNGSYVDLGKLKNPPNDAQDMAAALKELGFKVELLVDADLAKMEDAVIRLGNNLSQSADSTGFFFYAGHGVQSGGVNYLIPADARIASETFLKTKALAAQSVLDTLQGARNALNIVVLDACRDNPFSWSRSGSRGLTVVGSQPPGSIVAYATSAGSVAQDGTGRNGVFTQELLKNLKTPGLEIKDVFNRTGKAVSGVTAGKQVPAIYNQFFDNAYLTGSGTPAPVSAGPPSKAPSFGSVTTGTGSLSVKLASPGTLSVGVLSAEVPAGTVPVNDLPAGSHTVTVHYADGKTESHKVTVPPGGTASVSFTYVPAPKGADFVYELPLRTISIDGRTEDWGGLSPVLVDSTRDDKMPKRSGTNILYCFLCRDDRNIYVRVEYADGTPEWFQGVDRGVNLSQDAKKIGILSLTNKDEGLVIVRIINRSTDTEVIEKLGSFRNTPSGYEASYPLSSLPSGLKRDKPIEAFFYVNNYEIDKDASTDGCGSALVLIGK